MTLSSRRPRFLIDSGLSNAQAKRLSQELVERGVGVECSPSRLAGWDVWAYSNPINANNAIPADD
jgi:hypothetical protein